MTLVKKSLLVIYNFFRSRFVSLSWTSFKKTVWDIFHFPQFILFINRIRKKVSPQDSLFHFYRKILEFKKLYYSDDGIKNPARLYEILEKDFKSLNLPEPAIILTWHHGIQGFQYQENKIDNLLIFSAFSPGGKNIFRIENDNFHLALVAMAQALRNKRYITTSFDGGVGPKNFSAYILGNKMSFSKGLMSFIKKFEVPVVAYSVYRNPEGKLLSLVSKPLFSKKELEVFSEKDLLEKIIAHFENDLMKFGKYQINYWWLFKRMYNKELEPGTPL